MLVLVEGLGLGLADIKVQVLRQSKLVNLCKMGVFHDTYDIYVCREGNSNHILKQMQETSLCK